MGCDVLFITIITTTTTIAGDVALCCGTIDYLYVDVILTTLTAAIFYY